MKKVKLLITCLLSLFFVSTLLAQDKKGQQSKNIMQLKYLDTYASGHEGVNIYKMYDLTEDVICYLLMPTVAGRKQNEAGQWIYDANSVGAMSCIKNHQLRKN